MNKILRLLFFRLSHLGKIPLCNGMSERAPHIFGICFPLCYRCTFLILFFIISMIFFYKKKIKVKNKFFVLCFIPMIIDGCLQTFLGIESTNLRRVLTGGLFGLALGVVASQCYLFIDEKSGSY